jgi:hypothetical protein
VSVPIQPFFDQGFAILSTVSVATIYHHEGFSAYRFGNQFYWWKLVILIEAVISSRIVLV